MAIDGGRDLSSIFWEIKLVSLWMFISSLSDFACFFFWCSDFFSVFTAYLVSILPFCWESDCWRLQYLSSSFCSSAGFRDYPEFDWSLDLSSFLCKSAEFSSAVSDLWCLCLCSCFSCLLCFFSSILLSCYLCFSSLFNSYSFASCCLILCLRSASSLFYLNSSLSFFILSASSLCFSSSSLCFFSASLISCLLLTNSSSCFYLANSSSFFFFASSSSYFFLASFSLSLEAAAASASSSALSSESEAESDSLSDSAFSFS